MEIFRHKSTSSNMNTQQTIHVAMINSYNVILGHAEDDPHLLQRAVDYLKGSGSRKASSSPSACRSGCGWCRVGA